MSSEDNHKEEEIESSPHDDADVESTVDYEPDDELGDVGALKAKMKKLRDELSAVKKEKAEYLDGWQRSKAEMVNSRKEAAEATGRASLNARVGFLEDLLPALDSFDMAMMGDGWQKVDPAWRVGVESIRSQITSALQANGIESFAKVGDAYDPALHDISEEIEGGTSGTIAKVLRRGFRIKDASRDMIVRPASVVLYK